MLRLIASPSPVPFPRSLVEKNGRNSFCCTSALIPAPESVMCSFT